MVQHNTKQRNISLVMLCIVAIVWGAGFVLADDMLASGFYKTPGLQNALRFTIGTLLLVVLLYKHIKVTWKNLLYGAIGGSLLFGGFMLQLEGQNFITPAHCGFFTAMYFLITPFISWIVNKKAPKLSVFIAVFIAVVGLVILNIGKMPTEGEFWGIVMTLAGAVLFAIQIVWGDYLLRNDKIETNNLVVLQLIVASVLFILYTLIFESKHYSTLNIDAGSVWWKLAIVSILGTGFAYFAQTYAQNYVQPSQTSLILACESPIGAFISLLIGRDIFSWNIIVGGLLVIVAVVIIEVVPQVAERVKLKTQPVEKISTQSNNQNND